MYTTFTAALLIVTQRGNNPNIRQLMNGQYLGHLMRRVDSLEKTLMLGGIEGRRKRGRQRMRWLDGITDSVDKIGRAHV